MKKQKKIAIAICLSLSIFFSIPSFSEVQQKSVSISGFIIPSFNGYPEILNHAPHKVSNAFAEFMQANRKGAINMMDRVGWAMIQNSYNYHFVRATLKDTFGELHIEKVKKENYSLSLFMKGLNNESERNIKLSQINYAQGIFELAEFNKTELKTLGFSYHVNIDIHENNLIFAKQLISSNLKQHKKIFNYIKLKKVNDNKEDLLFAVGFYLATLQNTDSPMSLKLVNDKNGLYQSLVKQNKYDTFEDAIWLSEIIDMSDSEIRKAIVNRGYERYIVEFHSKKMTPREIAKNLGIGLDTVKRVLKKKKHL